MLPGSKFLIKSFLILTLLLAFRLTALSQALVYDLKQDWVYYDLENKGFLPIGQDNLHNNIIGFNLYNHEFNKFYLTISVGQKSFLFYRDVLLATLPAGTSSFSIDSLKKVIDNNQPVLTIYSKRLLPELKTEVRTQPISTTRVELFQPARFANNFSDFFYLSLTLIIVLFVILKTKFPDLADQYLLFQRAVKFRTIDELIYKIEFLGYPNNLFILLLSMILGFVTLSFMYFYPGDLAILDVYPSAATLSELFWYWLEITAILLAVIVVKYFLMLLFSSILSLKTTNIHFASLLRLLLYLALLLLFITSVQFIVIGVIPQFYYWLVIIFSILLIEGILFFKLTLVSTHTLLYNIIYLCATEIIPMLFLYKIISI